MKKKISRIKDIPVEKRPRERLKKDGAKSLSNYELLAVILGRGTRKEGVFSISRRVIEQYGSFPFIEENSVAKIQELFGLSDVQACQIVAVFELGRRVFHRSKEVFIRSPEDAYEYLREIRRLKKEHFRGLYLDIRNKLIMDETISIGVLNSSLVHPREVFEPAIKCGCSGIILAHNHPSGDPTPSKDDINITKQLVKASKIMEIDILDHIIIGDNSYTSLKEKGIIKK